MAKQTTGALSAIEYRNDKETRYLKENNIVDVTKTDLEKLKLKVTGETDLDSKLTEINKHVEDYFDGFILRTRDTTIPDLTLNGVVITDKVKDIIDSGDKAKLDALANYAVDKSGYEHDVDKIKDEEIKKALKEYKFELNDLRNDVTESGTETGTNNAFLNDIDKGKGKENEKEKNKESYSGDKDHSEAYQDLSYANIDEVTQKKIADIYKNNKIPKYLDAILDEEDKDELRRGIFRINPDLDGGLAGIIVDIREAAKQEGLSEGDKGYDEKYNQIYKNITPGDNEKTLKKNLKQLIDAGLITYKDEGGLDNEIKKIAKILSKVEWSKLDAFASAIESNPNVAADIKKIYNAQLLLKLKDVIKPDNVLEFLCDINGDGLLSVDQKKQKNQGDVGTIFGQQLYFHVEQAIKVKTVELGGDPHVDKDRKLGEQVVISNIVKNMQISDSKNLTAEQKKIFAKMSDPENCTRENLVKLLKGDENITAMPEMKQLFLDAINKINGGSNVITPNLSETLVGDEAKSIIDVKKSKTDLKNSIDDKLTKITDGSDASQEELRQFIRDHEVRVRETIFIKVMDVIDHVEITTNDGKKGTVTQLQAAGISKGREIEETLVEQAVERLILSGIYYSKTGGLRLMLGYGEEGTSESGKTKGGRGIEGGVIFKGGLKLALDASGDIAEQYNNPKVINANLSKVKTAKYVGAEAEAFAGINPKGRKIGFEASGGIEWLQDPVVGINQIDKQYTSVSQEIFHIRTINDVMDEKSFKDRILANITAETSDSKYGTFVTNNEKRLTENMNFIVRYMDANKFFGPEGKLLKLPEAERKDAINNLLDIIQSGSIEARRAGLVADLQGKIEITKLSFGVTTNALTLRSGRSKKNAPTPNATTGETTEPGNINTGGKGGSEADLGQDRLGVAGFYIGARISTWKNIYVPNEQQYLYTDYEIGQGIGADLIENPQHNLEKYGKYLEALYNDERLICHKDETSNKLIIEFAPEKGSKLTLQEFLNLHATTEAEKNFSLKDNTLIIGNVGEIGAYTVTEAKGVRRILSLGSKKLDETHRVTEEKENTVESITDKVLGNKERTQTKVKSDIIDKMTGIGTTPDAVKTETAAFLDAEGKLIKPAGTTTTFEDIVTGQKLKNGTLTITKTSDKTYTVKLDETYPTDKLTITYIDQKEYKPVPANRETMSYTIDKLFDFEKTSELYKAQNLLNALANDLKDLEKKSATNNTLYLEFLSSASNIIDSNGVIDADEIKKAIGYLEQLLPNNTAQLTELRGYLESQDSYTKSYVVDRLKQIFAKDAWYNGQNIGSILSSHSTKWETLTGPSEIKIPQELLKKLNTQRSNRTKSKEQYNDSPNPDPNLVGYTAFYRYVAGDKYTPHRKFSMTSLGNTTHQLDMYSIKENKDAAKSRFIENLKKNQYEAEYLAKNLQDKITKILGISLELKTAATGNLPYPDNMENLWKLLNGDEITLDSGQKISIDINRVFYLLGECCNESLGMDIKAINISKFKEDIIIPGKYTASGIPDKEYKNGMDVYGESLSIAGRPISQEKKVGLVDNIIRGNKPTAKSRSGANAGGTIGGGTPEAGNGSNE